MPPRSFIVGTAGHIDHGKTALVRALTGTDTDRLKEEKQRGITIELGFAHLQSDDQRFSFGIVDVPGHEHFIKSMVAGAGGVDLAILVIAADEGVMPQTREHLDICNLLGVSAGLVALTKRDLVDAEWLSLVSDDVRSALKGSFLADAPIIACSAQSGEGVEQIKAALATLADERPARQTDGLLRMPLDRVFSIKGFGTVVTGSLLSGAVAPGDEVAILPGSVKATVRRLQVHGETVERAVAGQRTAINLGGVDRQAVARGDLLAAPGTLAPSLIIDAEMRILPSARRRLKRRSKVLFHLGTRQQEASCVLLDSDELAPGEGALAQLRFEAGVVALPGDRFILRGFAKQENYGSTIGGGVIVRVLSRKIKRSAKTAIGLLQAIARAEPSERMTLEVLAAGPGGIDRADLQRRLPLPPRKLDQQLRALLKTRELIRFDRDATSVVHRRHFDALRDSMLQLVDRFHADNPLRSGVSRAELRSRLPKSIGARLFFSLLSSLEKDRALVVEKDQCRRPGHRGKVEASLGPLTDRIVALLDQAGLKALREVELSQALEADQKKLGAALRLLIANATLLRIDGLLFHQAHVEHLKSRLERFLDENTEISPSQFKGLVGQSRKFTIPLAEYFDAQRVTVRVGEVRKRR